MAEKRPLLALTLWPEWAWAFALHPPERAKRIENRDWRAPDHAIGGYLAVHAGRHIGGRPGRPALGEGLLAVQSMASRAGWGTELRDAPEGRRLIVEGYGERFRLSPTSVLTSAIVGVGRLVACVNLADEPQALARLPAGVEPGWGVPGAWWWVLEDYMLLPEPVACPGRQGLWRVEGEPLQQVRDQWRRRAA